MKQNKLIAIIASIVAITLPTVAAEPWWKQVTSKPLTTLIEEGIKSNHSLQRSRKQVDQTIAQAGLTRSLLFPKVSANSMITYQPLSNLQSGALPTGVPTSTTDDNMTSSSFTLDALYQLDVWGEEFQQHRAMKLNAQAAVLDYKNQELSFSVTIASLLNDAIFSSLQVSLLEKQLANVKEQLELTHNRYISGQGSSLAYLQQKQQAASLESSLMPVRFQKRSTTERLAAATGLSPDAITPLIPTAFIDLSAISTLNKTTDNRYDIQAMRLRTEAARISHLKTVFTTLPTVTLSGNVGKKWSDIGVDSWDDTWKVGASLSVPLFVGGATVAGLKESKASYESMQSQLSQVLVDATLSLEQAIDENNMYKEQATILKNQLDAAQLLYDESINQYRNGLSSYSDVLIAQNSLQQTENLQLQNERNRQYALLKVVQASGDIPAINREEE